MFYRKAKPSVEQHAERVYRNHGFIKAVSAATTTHGR